MGKISYFKIKNIIKYIMNKCNDLTFEECELFILRQSVDKIEKNKREK